MQRVLDESEVIFEVSGGPEETSWILVLPPLSTGLVRVKWVAPHDHYGLLEECYRFSLKDTVNLVVSQVKKLKAHHCLLFSLLLIEFFKVSIWPGDLHHTILSEE